MREAVPPALAYTVSDSTTMLRRNLRRLQRYPSLTLLLIGMPVVFLLLLVYVFGGQLSQGLGAEYAAGHQGRAGYLNYVAPGVLLMTVAAAVQGTAIVVAMDMTGGIIDRFRTMAIARSAVLTGHVLASLIQTLMSIGIVLAVAVALGFRPTAGPLEWLGAIGLLALFSLALIWLATALGLAAKSVETASNTPMFLYAAPVPRQRFRRGRVDARRAPPVRAVPAVHPHHRDPARAPHRHPDRLERDRRRGLERRHRRRLLPLGEAPLRAHARGLSKRRPENTKGPVQQGLSSSGGGI
ncbi:MAG TPA: ABC transporter permease [Gaiella sp.]